MTELAVIVPVLDRPQHVGPLLDSLATTTSDYQVYFVCDPDDEREIMAIREDGRGQIFLLDGNYAQKINHVVKYTEEPLLFFGADDLRFQPNWFGHASALLKDGAKVVGLNDLIVRSRQHATHFLVARDYAELPTVDGGPGPLHEGYDHSCVDDELVGTATYRGVYAYALDAHVQHLHPDNQTAPLDDTYRKGRKKIREDKRIWKHRCYQFIERGFGQ